MSKEEIEMMLAAASGWVGYKEKSVKNYADYEHFDARAGKGNYTRFGRIADVVLNGKDRRVKDGYPWCAMFILAVLYEMKAGRQDCSVPAGTLPVYNNARQWIKDTLNRGRAITYFAGCSAWLSAYRSNGNVSTTPTRGDFVVYIKDAVFPGDRGLAYHIGIVEDVFDGGRTFVAIEGNTSSESSDIEPNGGCVARKTRKNKNCLFLKNNFVFLPH